MSQTTRQRPSKKEDISFLRLFLDSNTFINRDLGRSPEKDEGRGGKVGKVEILYRGYCGKRRTYKRLDAQKKGDRERERRKVCKNRGKNWTTGETLPVLTCVLHHGCVIIFNDRYLNSLWLWKNTASRFYLISRARIHYRPVVNIAVTLHADIFWKKRSIREYRERSVRSKVQPTRS